MQKDLSELKKRALLAKQRMKMGYWQQMEKERERLLSKEDITDTYRQKISEMQRAVIRRDEGIIIKNPEVSRDEELYGKVKEIIDNNEFISNPIGRLVNHDEYDKLDEGGKQRYILLLSKKYRELKDRYCKERLGKEICK